MDGTLIDSMQYWSLSAGDDLSKYPSVIEYMFEKYNTAILPKPHSMELLKLLKENGIPVCIASDTPRQLSDGFFKRFDFDSIIDFYMGSDDVGVYKSVSGQIYLAAAEKLGVDPKDCVVFEDSRVSVHSARIVGMDVVGIYDSANAQHEDEIRSACIDYIYDLSEMMK